MIKFQCEYCRGDITVSDYEDGKAIRCPHCFRVVSAPSSLIKIDGEGNIEEQEPRLARRREEAEQSCRDGSAKIVEEEEEDEDKSIFDLHFDENQLFSMSLALLILYAVDLDMREDISLFITQMFGGGSFAVVLSIIFLILPFLTGLFFCIYHAFRRVEKSWGEKTLMLFFGVAINAGTGLYLGWYILKGAGQWWLFLFAVWNIIYSVVLILKFEYIGLDDSESYINYVSDWDTTIGQVVFTSVATIAILMCCRYWLNFFWIITYSACITYINIFDRVIQKILSRGYRHLTR